MGVLIGGRPTAGLSTSEAPRQTRDKNSSFCHMKPQKDKTPSRLGYCVRTCWPGLDRPKIRAIRARLQIPGCAALLSEPLVHHVLMLQSRPISTHLHPPSSPPRRRSQQGQEEENREKTQPLFSPVWKSLPLPSPASQPLPQPGPTMIAKRLARQDSCKADPASCKQGPFVDVGFSISNLCRRRTSTASPPSRLDGLLQLQQTDTVQVIATQHRNLSL